MQNLHWILFVARIKEHRTCTENPQNPIHHRGVFSGNICGSSGARVLPYDIERVNNHNSANINSKTLVDERHPARLCWPFEWKPNKLIYPNAHESVTIWWLINDRAERNYFHNSVEIEKSGRIITNSHGVQDDFLFFVFNKLCSLRMITEFF